jgi:hypothetical protein
VLSQESGNYPWEERERGHKGARVHKLRELDRLILSIQLQIRRRNERGECYSNVHPIRLLRPRPSRRHIATAVELRSSCAVWRSSRPANAFRFTKWLSPARQPLFSTSKRFLSPKKRFLFDQPTTRATSSRDNRFAFLILPS